MTGPDRRPGALRELAASPGQSFHVSVAGHDGHALAAVVVTVPAGDLRLPGDDNGAARPAH